MTSQLEISVEGNLGVIALNRPEAINALSREMIDGIFATLERWRQDEAVRVVLFEARGSRGFCAGGDVRAIRKLVVEGEFDAADAYFAAEYAMNLAISTYPKPVAALGHGVVMGGGIGILGHARYSFVASDSRFAMPEAAIGFVSDVGVNALLALVPEPRALAFLLSGMTVGVGDALTLGLCDAAIDPARREAVRAGIVAAAAQTDAETTLVMLMQAESIQADSPSLCGDADRLAEAFGGGTTTAILTALAAAAAGDDATGRLRDAIVSRSPTSLAAVLLSHRAARQRPGIADVLTLDLRLARFMVRQPDFVEGVRAVLVDKDQTPRWRPATLEGVDLAGITRALSD
jgi:enoyl-CoA hydratase